MAESQIHVTINRGKCAAPDAVVAAGRGRAAPAAMAIAAAADRLAFYEYALALAPRQDD